MDLIKTTIIIYLWSLIYLRTFDLWIKQHWILGFKYFSELIIYVTSKNVLTSKLWHIVLKEEMKEIFSVTVKLCVVWISDILDICTHRCWDDGVYTDSALHVTTPPFFILHIPDPDTGSLTRTNGPPNHDKEHPWVESGNETLELETVDMLFSSHRILNW